MTAGTLVPLFFDINAQWQPWPIEPARFRSSALLARRHHSRLPSKCHMAYLNEHYLKLKAGYLFPEIARRVNSFCQANPEAAKGLIRCGIGDVTEPLPPAVIAALHKA